MALDITELYNVSSGAIREAAKTAATNKPDAYADQGFDSLLHTAIDNLTTKMRKLNGRSARPRTHMI